MNAVAEAPAQLTDRDQVALEAARGALDDLAGLGVLALRENVGTRALAMVQLRMLLAMDAAAPSPAAMPDAQVRTLRMLGSNLAGAIAQTVAQAFGRSGVARIAMERGRQVTEEGWTPEHDENHAEGELALAGGLYAWHASNEAPDRAELRTRPPHAWPFVSLAWKPGPDDSKASRIRELEKAGALIAAEIDRLQVHD